MRRSSGFVRLCLTLTFCLLVTTCAFAQKAGTPHPPPLFDTGQLVGMLVQTVWLLVKPFWYVIVLFVAITIGKIIVARAQYRKLAASGILEIDEMDGRTFEQYLETLFEKLGYSVELTPYAGDWGADLVIRKDGVKTVVQAKRHKQTVGPKAVQEVVASKKKYDSAEAMVVTNSTYTKAAQELARVNGVILWDRQRLIQALSSVNKESLVPASGSSTTDNLTPQQSEVSAKTTNGSAVSPFNAVADSSCCCICGKPVSAKVLAYCRDNTGKFGGRTYCYEHQREASRSSRI